MMGLLFIGSGKYKQIHDFVVLFLKKAPAAEYMWTVIQYIYHIYIYIYVRFKSFKFDIGAKTHMSK